MLGLFVRVQTFRQRPFVPSHNFCHPESHLTLTENEAYPPRKIYMSLGKPFLVAFFPPCLIKVFAFALFPTLIKKAAFLIPDLDQQRFERPALLLAQLDCRGLAETRTGNWEW